VPGSPRSTIRATRRHPTFGSVCPPQSHSRENEMDSRLKDLAAKLDAGLIARREFLRNAAVITGGTAAGLHALKGMAGAQSATKLRVWLFKSFVTAGNDVLEKQVQNWAKDRKVTVEIDWATFGDREPKFVAAIEAGNPPDVAEMNINGPMRYKAALKDMSKVAGDIATPRGGMLPFAEKSMKVDGKFYGVPRYSMTTVFYIRKAIMAPKTLLVLTPGGPSGSFVGASCYNWGIFQKSKYAELGEDLIRYMEDEEHFAEYVKVSVGQAGPVYKRRTEDPYWKSDPNFNAI